VALSANKLIWPVMSPMIWTMSLIASAAELSHFARSSAFATRKTASFAVSFDLSMASEISRMEAFNSTAPAATCSIIPRTFSLFMRNDLSGGAGSRISPP
jgi:hypothetical protein